MTLVGACRRAVKRALFRAASVVHRLDRGAGDAVLLTFDDGPHPEVTPAVLDRLNAYGARAVFFVVGNRIPRAPWVLGDILRAGHMIGNHSFSHQARYRLSEYTDDLRRCQDAVAELTGLRPRLFRPPLGRITPGALCAARRCGLTTVHWSVEDADWALRNHKAARSCGERLGRAVGPGDIVLLHDDNPCVLTVLEVLLPALSARGIDLITAERLH